MTISLKPRTDIDHWKASKLDLSQILYRPKEASKFANHCTCLQKHKIDDVMDHELIKMANKAIKNKEKVWIFKQHHKYRPDDRCHAIG